MYSTVHCNLNNKVARISEEALSRAMQAGRCIQGDACRAVHSAHLRRVCSVQIKSGKRRR